MPTWLTLEQGAGGGHAREQLLRPRKGGRKGIRGLSCRLDFSFQILAGDDFVLTDHGGNWWWQEGGGSGHEGDF